MRKLMDIAEPNTYEQVLSMGIFSVYMVHAGHALSAEQNASWMDAGMKRIDDV